MFKKIYIEITNVCNLNCKFCPQTARQKQFMSSEDFEKIIKKIRKYTNLVCLHVKGEPLLHKNLDEILEILDKYDVKANITTNGTLIDKNIETLTQSKAVRQINFSIHSITQNSNMHNQYMQKIFNSVEKLQNVKISYRLWNIKSFKQNEINREIIQKIEEYYNIQNLVEQLKYNDYFKIKDNIFINQDIEFIWPDINNKPIIEQGRCLALKNQIAILVDGTVVPCCLDNDGNMKLGNIFEEELEDILSKNKSIEIKENFANNKITCELCKTCGFLKNLELKRNNI